MITQATKWKKEKKQQAVASLDEWDMENDAGRTGSRSAAFGSRMSCT
jgi:hypothetical protein